MNTLTPLIVLKALVKHETLTFPDLVQEKNLGINLPSEDIEMALENLESKKLVSKLDGIHPPTYTITQKGIEESLKLEI